MQHNHCEIAGYLGKRPEVQYTPSGTPVVKARLAETQRYKDKSGHDVERTEWHTIVLWGDAALYAAENYDKGDNLLIKGSYRSRKFTPRDGSERTVWELTVFQSCKLWRNPKSKTGEKPPALEGANETDHELPEETPHAPATSSNAAWPA